jgi:diaminohydroxyphosphoribosylaminopyrimidine deaminase / 5-amino-6-(5-phosphoribosylamino)uracil reductase
MTDQSSDDQLLRQALELAREGIGHASPNPYVGAVILDADGNIAGTGVYTYAGVKHAEVLALQQAGQRAHGGTLYINLEPHSHQGRTPPCTDALIAAGVRRVVASMADPNPKVSGKGFEKLRSAGIQVEVGGLEAEARQLNEAFARYIRHGIPLVTLKSAMTLNAKIAASSMAHSEHAAGIPAGGWITGEAARAHVHEQRHASDAILVGISTILADDPLLTDRSSKSRRRPLFRVVLDSHLRIPVESRLVQSVINHGTSSDVVVFYADGNDEKKRELTARGVRVEHLSTPGTGGRLDLHAVLKRLGEHEITSVMIEGGSTVNAAALALGIVDKVFLYYAPQIAQEAGSVPFLASSKFPNVLRIRNSRLRQFEDDFAIEGYLRDPYRD